MPATHTVRAALLAVLVAGCGGGGGGGGSPPPPPPPPAAQAPTFTSAAAVSVQENWIDVVYRPTATDPQGDTITYGAITGEDAHHFEMNPVTREVRFDFHPNFESQSDETNDNIYRITFSASDGANTTTHNVAVTLTDVRPGFRVRRLQGDGGRVVAGYPDGSGRVAIWRHDGLVRLVDPATDSTGTTLLDITRLQPTTPGPYNFIIRELAFSPNFLTDSTLYMSVYRPPEQLLQVWKYRTIQVGGADQIEEASQDIILSIPMNSLIQSGGLLQAYPDGTLLVGVGTGNTASGAEENVAQDPNSLYGKLLRIDPRTDSFPADPLKDYAIPAQNPYASSGGAAEIWGRGVASPRDSHYDRLEFGAGKLIFADSGTFTDHTLTQVSAQEINRPGSTDMNGPNFGWPLQVGLAWRDAMPPTSLIYSPVTNYAPSVGIQAIVGGVYRGPIEEFRELVFFGDANTQKIWSAPSSLLAPGSTTTTPSLYTDRTAAFTTPTLPVNGPNALDFDTRGNLYISAASGIYIVEPAP